MALLEQIEIPYRSDAADYLASVRSLGGSVWLDSGKPGSTAGRWDIVSAAPLFTLRLEEPELSCHGAAPEPVHRAGTLQEAVVQTLQWLKGLSGAPPAAIAADDLPFQAGLIGSWNYDLGFSLHNVTPTLPDTVQLPHAVLGCYTWALLQDHEQQRSLLVFHPVTPAELRQQVQERIAAVDDSRPAADFRLSAPFCASISKREYLAAIGRIRDYIHAGDCYQVNFTQHWSAPFAGDAWLAYRLLRGPLASPFSAWLDLGRQQVLCLSPERFIEIRKGEVETRPIKGTLRRGSTAAEDAQNAAALTASGKDRAENLMIVDLMRNDLGRSCEPGSIRADRLFELESYPSVHHLVSTVTGTLRADLEPVDLLMAAFPGGSITGAPKQRAMEIIEELESAHRGLYCGCIGYLDLCGAMDTNIVIRTLVAENGYLHCWAGGGIVADSDPEQEYRESLDKVGLLLELLEQTLK